MSQMICGYEVKVISNEEAQIGCQKVSKKDLCTILDKIKEAETCQKFKIGDYVKIIKDVISSGNPAMRVGHWGKLIDIDIQDTHPYKVEFPNFVDNGGHAAHRVPVGHGNSFHDYDLEPKVVQINWKVNNVNLVISEAGVSFNIESKPYAVGKSIIQGLIELLNQWKPPVVAFKVGDYVKVKPSHHRGNCYGKIIECGGDGGNTIFVEFPEYSENECCLPGKLDPHHCLWFSSRDLEKVK